MRPTRNSDQQADEVDALSDELHDHPEGARGRKASGVFVSTAENAAELDGTGRRKPVLSSRHSLHGVREMYRFILFAVGVVVLGPSVVPQSIPKVASSPSRGGLQKQLDTAKDASANEDVKWVKFSDPNEHAFTVDVPEGWEAIGGTLRRNAIDVTGFLRILSPDRSMMLLSSDPGPAFFHTAGLASLREDRAYVPGKDYARSWGDQSLPALCSDLKAISDAERPDIEKGKFGAAGAVNHAGEVVFSCTHKGESARALVVVLTYEFPVRCCDAPSLWGVGALFGWIGPANQLEHGRQMIEHIMLSAQNDPEWDKSQAKRVSEALRIPYNALQKTQTPEWEKMRQKGEVQLKEVNQKFNPPSAAADQP